MLNPSSDPFPNPTSIGPLALESILLGELTHRTVNDFSSAAAAVHLARRSPTQAGDARVLDRLADQLNALGTIQRLLQAPGHGPRMELGSPLSELCRAMAVARFAERGITLQLDAQEVTIEPRMGWRILMIIAELLVNAARHAFGEQGGSVRVQLLQRGMHVTFIVTDDGRGRVGPRSGRWGYGSSVVHLLAAQIAGEMSTVSSSSGTSIEISVPCPELLSRPEAGARGEKRGGGQTHAPADLDGGRLALGMAHA